MIEISSDEEDRLARIGSYLLEKSERQHRFPEIKGLCRTCECAHIIRTEYDEVPVIYCTQFEHRARMPMDVKECTRYSKVGGLSIRAATEIALLIDKRKLGGQYL